MKSKRYKTSSKRRERSRSHSDDGKSKRSRPRSKSDKDKDKDRDKVKETKTAPRKTRWQESEAAVSSKTVPESTPQKSGPPPRIKDILSDKDQIVELLFQTVPGATLQKLIPDYLQKKSRDELKKLCLEQIKLMSDEVILQVISGKDASSKVEEKTAEVQKTVKTEKPDAPREKESEKSQKVEKKPEVSSKPDGSDNASNDVLELHTTTTEMESILDEETQIPVIIKDEVAKALITPERDAELLELEMRARAIRSLLKARSQAPPEEDGNT